MVEYITHNRNVITEPIYPEVVHMVSDGNLSDIFFLTRICFFSYIYLFKKKNLTEIFKEDQLPSVHQQNGNIIVFLKISLPLLARLLCTVEDGYCCGLT